MSSRRRLDGLAALVRPEPRPDCQHEYSDWADANGFTPAGGLHFDENSLILGYSIAFGSGDGTADIYMDNLKVDGVTMDFYG